MWGIELKWFILFALIFLLGAGIVNLLTQIKNELENEFLQIKQIFQGFRYDEPLGATITKIGEECSMISDRIDELPEQSRLLEDISNSTGSMTKLLSTFLYSISIEISIWFQV